MRKDIDKVIFERGRTSGCDKPRKRKKARGWPNKISCLKDTIDTWERKEQRYNDSVVTKFLTQSVGRKWDDVWAEICKATKGRLSYKIRKLFESRVDKSKNRKNLLFDFYVKDGILCYNPPLKYKRNKLRSKIVRVNGRAYFKYENIWYCIQPEPLPTFATGVWINDVFRTTTTYFYQSDFYRLKDFYGEAIYTKTKRQANSREIRKIRAKLEKVD